MEFGIYGLSTVESYDKIFGDFLKRGKNPNKIEECLCLCAQIF